MRYHALILIFIILVSGYILKESSVFSENTSNYHQANVSNSFDLAGVSRVSEDSNVSSKTETEIPTLQLISEVAEVSSVEQPILEERNCQGVESKIFFVKSLDDGGVLFEKNIQNRWPIASITKLMTSLVALENMNLSTVLQITPQSIQESEEYTSLGMNEKYTVEDLVKAALVFSSNDASYALAEGIGKEAFIAKMNEKAKELGMGNTFFYEPSGLSFLNQSTVNDLYSLVTYIYQNKPIILDMTRKKSVSLKERTSGKSKTFSNINPFAGQSIFFGGKTGFIDQSGGNLITLFQKNAKMYFIAVLSSSNRFEEVQKLYQCIQ